MSWERSIMTGSLQVKKGKYYIAINYKEGGKYKQKWYPTGLEEKGNRRKAEKMLREKLEDLEKNNITIGKEPLYSDFIIEWLNVLQLKQNTFETYEYSIKKHIVPYFEEKKLKLKDITPQHIQKLYKLKLDNGLSPNTVLKIHANIHKSLDYALKNNLIAYNPSDRVTLPKKQKYKGKMYSVAEVQTLFSVIIGDPIEPAVVLASILGLRRSEVLGLKWDVVDFNSGCISIEHTAVRVKGGILYSDTTKTQASNRSLPLMGFLLEFLRKLKTHQLECKLMCGQDYNDNNYICKWDNGNPIKPDYVTNHYKAILEKYKLRPIRFHDLRHTSASLLLSLGFTLKEVQEWLGHEDITTTANIYGHLEFQSKNKMADKLDVALLKHG